MKLAFDEHMLVCKYAANDVKSSDQFAEEFASHLKERHQADLRLNLDESQVYTLWCRLIEEQIDLV